MLSTAIAIGFAMVAVSMALTLWRLAKGPSPTDRILALDTLATNVIALVILTGLWSSRSFSFEAALIIAMMGFVATVALCKFLLSGKIIE